MLSTIKQNTQKYIYRNNRKLWKKLWLVVVSKIIKMIQKVKLWCQKISEKKRDHKCCQKYSLTNKMTPITTKLISSEHQTTPRAKQKQLWKKKRPDKTNENAQKRKQNEKKNSKNTLIFDKKQKTKKSVTKTSKHKFFFLSFSYI